MVLRFFRKKNHYAQNSSLKAKGEEETLVKTFDFKMLRFRRRNDWQAIKWIHISLKKLINDLWRAYGYLDVLRLQCGPYSAHWLLSFELLGTSGKQILIGHRITNETGSNGLVKVLSEFAPNISKKPILSLLNQVVCINVMSSKEL